MSSLPSPPVAAGLSLLFPGLGQFYAGARQRGVLFAIPWTLFLLGLLFLVLTNRLLELVSRAESMVAALIFLVAVLLYHLAAVIDAYTVAARERELSGAGTPRAAPLVVALLVALLLVPYGVLEVYGIQANNALDAIARGDNEEENPFIPKPDEEPSASPAAPASPTPAGSGASPEPSTPDPGATDSPGDTPGTSAPPPNFGPIDAAWTENGRLDVLVVGADAGPGRSSVRTDTMILLSVEIQTGKAAMFGFPRNMIQVPLPRESAGARPGGIFDDMLSALWRRAAEEPAFAGSEGVGSECARDFACERAWRALSGAIQNMAGVPIDGIVAVDLNGFASLVDAVGGIWIDVPEPGVVDDNYPRQDGTRIRIDIEPGCQKLNGTLALAYARSRHQDSDYQRMRRQQLVLRAIRRQFDPLAMLPRVPELLNIARDNLFMTFGRDDIPLLARVAARVDADRIHQVRFQRETLRHVTPAAIEEMRGRVRGIFGEPQPAPTASPEPGERCPPN